MCGIFATVSRGTPVSQSLLQQAIETLYHRGPEKRATWLSPDRLVGLAHARLSIIDIATGDQPITSARGNVIVANGEFYGHRKLRQQLKNAGWEFGTDSDSEVALALYEKYGLGFVSRLRGEFAFSIWDRRLGKLISVRDRFGVKPLYYYEDSERLVLASEVKALLAAGVAPRLDRDSFVAHLLFYKGQDATLFGGIKQVPPGCMLITSGGQSVVKRYWDLDYPDHPAQAMDSGARAAAIEQLQEKVIDAVEVRLDADVPLGHYLSGGLDSSAVLGVAARHLKKPLTSFTVKFDHQDYDESLIAQRTAAFAGSEHRMIEVDAGDFADHIESVVWHGESVGINSNAVARFLQSRAVRDAGFKAVLSGDGADELFYGYNFHQMDYLLSTYDGDEAARLARFAALQSAGQLSSSIPPTWALSAFPACSDKLGFTPSWISVVLNNRMALRDGLLHPELRGDIGPDRILNNFLGQQPVYDQLRGKNPVQQSMYLWTKSVLCNQILYSDRLDMANSIEVRMPLLDHELFEFARTLPVAWQFKEGEEKSLFRESMKPFLTEQIITRIKKPFIAPPSTLQQDGKLFQLIQDVMHSSSLEQLGLFDKAQLMKLSASLKSKNSAELVALEVPMMLILTSYFLCKKFNLTA